MDIGEALVGQLVDARYRLVRVLGSGAFGFVFEAEHVAAAQVLARVALKLIPHRIAGGVEQFAELKRGLALSHPNVIRCYSAGDASVRLNDKPFPVLYLAMELAESTLAEQLRHGRLGQAEAIEVLRDVASGLAYLVESDLAHRDLKPSNVLRVGGRWKIADFGVSAPLNAGQTAIADAAGTFMYQPPESFDGKVSPAGDCWSLGVMLLESLTGQWPFDAASPGEWLYLLKESEANIPPGLPEPFDEIIPGCLRRDRAQRLNPTSILKALERRQNSQLPNTRAYAVVAPEGGHFDSVIAAVRQAAPWSRVLVKPGVYKGTVVLDKPLELIALGASADVVIDGGTASALVVRTADAMVRGFTLLSSATQPGPAAAVVEVRSGQSMLDLCEVLASTTACMHVSGRDARPIVRRCRFIGGRHEAVIFDEDAEGSLEGCEIRSAPRAGLAIREKANPIVRRCQILASGLRGLHAGQNSRGVVEDCHIQGGSGPAVELSRGAQPVLRRLRVTAGSDVGIQASSGAKAIIASCSIDAPPGKDWKLASGHQVQRL